MDTTKRKVNCPYIPIPPEEVKYHAPKHFYIPVRRVMTFFIFLAFFIIYSLRINLSVAIVAMVNSTVTKTNKTVYSECSEHGNLSTNTTKIKTMKGEFIWDEKLQGVILGAFYYGYVITHIPGGRLAEIIGGKWLLGGGILCSSLLTMIIPFAARTSPYFLIAVRLLTGLFEGVTYPAMFAIFAHWIPLQERSTTIGITGSGAYFGNIVTLPAAAFLCHSNFLGGWPSAFYVFGLLGCLWFLLWAAIATNSPEQHPRISREELYYIQINRKFDNERRDAPWKEILTSVPLWGLTISKFCGIWGFTTLMTELPTYLNSVLLVPIEKNGLFNSVMYLVQAFTIVVGGLLSDFIYTRGYLKASPTRKVFQCTAFLGAAISLSLVPSVGCNETLAIVLLTTAMGIYGISSGGEGPLPLDMAPDFAGTLCGISNGLGNVASMFAPLIVGIFTENNENMEHWSKVFYLSSGIYVLGAIIFSTFASAERQPWSKSENELIINRELDENDKISPNETSLLYDSIE